MVILMKLERINKDNFELALKIENEIFPLYNAKYNYLSSLDNDSKNKFFIIYENNMAIGVTGIYFYNDDNSNAWLGFFGLLEEYRYKGYGKQSLKMTEDYAKELGFKFIRLFTDRLNIKAINFYKKYGYTFEEYDSDLEGLKDEFDVVIGSKSLDNGDVPLWNNKFINLTKQTIKQNN